MKTRILALVVIAYGWMLIGCSNGNNQTAAAAPPCTGASAATSPAVSGAAIANPCATAAAVTAAAGPAAAQALPQVAQAGATIQQGQVPNGSLLPASAEQVKGQAEKVAAATKEISNSGEGMEMSAASVDSGSQSYDRGGLLTIPGYLPSESEIERLPSSAAVSLNAAPEPTAPQASGSAESSGGTIK